MDWTCYEKRTRRARKHHIHCSTLDTGRKTEERTTQEQPASNRGRRAEDPCPLIWGTMTRLAQNRQQWKAFVVALHAKRHNGHEKREKNLFHLPVSFQLGGRRPSWLRVCLAAQRSWVQFLPDILEQGAFACSQSSPFYGLLSGKASGCNPSTAE